MGEDDGFDIATINPGVRRLVALLRRHGFETTDSGDGVTNVGVIACALEFPHVFMVCDHEREAARVASLLRAAGVELAPGMVEYSFDPVDGVRVIGVLGVSDRDLKPEDARPGPGGN